jgi:hypothetical protein
LIEAVRNAGFDKAVQDFEVLLDTNRWVEYALNQINMVQEEAQKFDNLIVHTWPDRRLVDKADPAVARQLREMRKAISPESFVNSSGVAASQSPLKLK